LSFALFNPTYTTDLTMNKTDKTLVEYCGFDHKISNWLNANSEFQRNNAAEIICEFLEDLLRNDLSSSGKKALSRLRNALVTFEDVIIAIKKGITKKFYRDHLNHAIRVALLAHGIAKTMSKDKNSFNLPSMKEECLLAGLAHDIGYPISIGIFDELKNALQESFITQNFSANLHKCDPLIIMRYSELVKPFETTNGAVNEKSHELLSSLMFFALLEEEKCKHDKYLRIAHAILLHNSNIRKEFKFSDYPISVILILADELQEWGRVIEGKHTPSIETQITLSPCNVDVKFKYESNNYFSPLKQIESKQFNLERLILDNSFSDLTITFELPQNYNEINVKEICEFVRPIIDRGQKALDKTHPIILRSYRESIQRIYPNFESLGSYKLEELDNFERCLKNDFFNGSCLTLYCNDQEILMSILPFQQVIFKKVENKIKLFSVSPQNLHCEGDILACSSPKWHSGSFLPSIMATIVSLKNKEKAQKLFKDWYLERYAIPSLSFLKFDLMQKTKEFYSENQLKDVRLGFLKLTFFELSDMLTGFECYLNFLFALAIAELQKEDVIPHKHIHKYIKERSPDFFIECFTKIKESSLTEKECNFLNTLSILCSNIANNKYFIFLPKEI